MKTVLVFGHLGQLGRALFETVPKNISIVGRDLPKTDITNIDSVKLAFTKTKPDLVINAAAYTAVDNAESDKEKTFAVNETGAENIAKICALTKIKMIQISTDFVFDGNTSRPYATNANPNPLSIYGKSKLAGENAVQRIHKNAVILRTSWLYGPTGSNFMLTMLRLMKKHNSVRVIDDQIGSPTSTFSLANTIWKFAAYPNSQGIFHFTNAGVASWYDFAVAIAEEAFKAKKLEFMPKISPIPTEDYPTQARRPAYCVLNKTKTYNLLQIQPVHWRTCLRKVLIAHD